MRVREQRQESIEKREFFWTRRRHLKVEAADYMCQHHAQFHPSQTVLMSVNRMGALLLGHWDVLDAKA